jgi:hypothetical protein
MNSNFCEKRYAEYVKKVTCKSMHLIYRQDNLHRMTWYTGTCGIIALCLLYMLTLWSNMGLGSNSCLMVGTTLTIGHYKTDIISSVGHPRSDLVVQLVLYTVAYKIWGTGVVL